jgi:hypothetical protein
LKTDAAQGPGAPDSEIELYDDTGEGTRADRVHRYRARVFAERARLRAALPDAAGHQRRVLTDLVAFNSDTAYGRRHGFASIRTLDDLRAAVPVQTFADHMPWIERAAAGEHAVLTADDPAVFFTSSGSTGERKKIPVTPRFMRTTFLPFYYAAWAPIAEHFAATLTRPEYFLNLKQEVASRPALTSSGRPHLGASQVDFGTAFGEPLAAEPGSSAPWMSLPIPVDDDDHSRKMYLRLRLAVESDVRGIVGINPAMVAALPYQLNLWWPEIVRDVHDGTLSGRRCREPRPERARELQALADYFGQVRPAHIWPRLRVIFCWTTGVASLYLDALRAQFGADVSVLPAPIAASEGPVGVALDRHGTAGSLVVTGAVYEFADADAAVTATTDTLSWEDLEVGRDYHVIFTHVGGFYRYAVGDVVRVVDRLGGVPRVEYAGRATCSDAAGERLREAQVVRALATAARGGGLDVRNAACRVEPGGDQTPAYRFAVASGSLWSGAERAAMAGRLDHELSGEAPGYGVARRRGALGSPMVAQVPADAFLRDWMARLASGIRPTQVKDKLFRPVQADWDRLVGSARTRTPQEGP